MTVGQNIKAFREAQGMNQEEFGSIIGKSKSAISQWESDIHEPRIGIVEKLAQHFGVLKSDIIGEVDDGRKHPKGAISIYASDEPAYIPHFGRIAAGQPIEMCDVVSNVEVPFSVQNEWPTSFLLTVIGDSMNKVVLDTHLALIVPDQEVHDGDIVAVNINGYDATLKRWHKANNSVVLSPDSYDPQFVDIVIDENDPDALNLRVLGKYKWSMSPYKG